ncbi:COMT [Symbiodinium necroappetens]|uniref:catechol O-methyltransferase n=1 Tax=Symbiodinium necroappetens TaxID=1628268 RepID=A0A813AHS5_9DINO|nr:COMT [Symbiodinium necroappetens]
MKPLVPRAPDRVERNTPSSLRAFRMRNLQLTRANTQFCEMTDLDFTAAASEDSQEVHEAEPLRDVPSLQALLQTREGRLTKRHAAALRWAKGEALDRLGAAYAAWRCIGLGTVGGRRVQWNITGVNFLGRESKESPCSAAGECAGDRLEPGHSSRRTSYWGFQSGRRGPSADAGPDEILQENALKTFDKELPHWLHRIAAKASEPLAARLSALPAVGAASRVSTLRREFQRVGGQVTFVDDHNPKKAYRKWQELHHEVCHVLGFELPAWRLRRKSAWEEAALDLPLCPELWVDEAWPPCKLAPSFRGRVVPVWSAAGNARNGERSLMILQGRIVRSFPTRQIKALIGHELGRMAFALLTGPGLKAWAGRLSKVVVGQKLLEGVQSMSGHPGRGLFDLIGGSRRSLFGFDPFGRQSRSYSLGTINLSLFGGRGRSDGGHAQDGASVLQGPQLSSGIVRPIMEMLAVDMVVKHAAPRVLRPIIWLGVLARGGPESMMDSIRQGMNGLALPGLQLSGHRRPAFWAPMVSLMAPFMHILVQLGALRSASAVIASCGRSSVITADRAAALSAGDAEDAAAAILRVYGQMPMESARGDELEALLDEAADSARRQKWTLRREALLQRWSLPAPEERVRELLRWSESSTGKRLLALAELRRASYTSSLGWWHWCWSQSSESSWMSAFAWQQLAARVLVVAGPRGFALLFTGGLGPMGIDVYAWCHGPGLWQFRRRVLETAATNTSAAGGQTGEASRAWSQSNWFKEYRNSGCWRSLDDLQSLASRTESYAEETGPRSEAFAVDSSDTVVASFFGTGPDRHGVVVCKVADERASSRCGQAEEALQLLQRAAQRLPLDAAGDGVWLACGGLSEELPRTAWTIRSGHDYAKELRLLQNLFSVASRDSSSVADFMESYGKEELPRSSKWLKIAGGQKAQVLKVAADASPGGLALELGLYCGFSALHLSSSKRVVSVEADLAHALIAETLLNFAGIAHQVEIVVGHTEDVLPWLLGEMQRRSRAQGQLNIGFVFMDQRGSRYHTDLDVLLQSEVLQDGAVVVADNVLKPGAPCFLWALAVHPAFTTDVLEVAEPVVYNSLQYASSHQNIGCRANCFIYSENLMEQCSRML